MTIQLLPDGFDNMLNDAVRTFWSSRSTGDGAQEGARGQVVGGKNLDGMAEVVRAVATRCGLPDEAILTRGKLTLPGHYRPSKDWDVLIIHERRLLAALEFKSHVGSFGNNFNNRVEEALGNITDLRRAGRAGLYAPDNHTAPREPVAAPAPLFVGYLLLLEDCAKSTSRVQLASPHYHSDPAFTATSYADRYKLFCERLVEERLYDAASLMLSKPPDTHRALSAPTSTHTLFARLAAALTR
jgi:hypothetical protein